MSSSASGVSSDILGGGMRWEDGLEGRERSTS